MAALPGNAVLTRLAAGDKLHMQFVDGKRVWWFEDPRAEVADVVATKLRDSGELSELGDSLFGFAGNSQSWGTFKQEQEGEEVICGKCLRALPGGIRNDHRRYWREYRKWDRRIKRTGDILKAQRMHEIRDRWAVMIEVHWDREIKPYFLAPEKPAGIEAFLEEAGLK